MKTLIEDEEMKHLRATAEGSKHFKESRLWECLAALDLKGFWKLPARERLAVGYYKTARRREEQLRPADAGRYPAPRDERRKVSIPELFTERVCYTNPRISQYFGDLGSRPCPPTL